MLSSRTLLAVLLTTTSAMAAKLQPGQAACPAKLLGHPIREVGMFNGPPAQMGEMVGDEEGWDVTMKQQDQQDPGFFIVCRFRGTKSTITVPVPISMTRCSGIGTERAPQVACK